VTFIGYGPALGGETKTPTPTATSNAAPAPATFDTFRLLSERNIFDPNRIGRSARGSSESAQPRGDLITLVGAMDSEKGLYAFFDSPDTNFRKALHEGDTIALYTVKHITTASVELMRDGKPYALRIGQQIRRPEGGDWSIVEGEAARSSPTITSTDVSTLTIPADASDTLRRLMEQRQKQLKQ
jgi:hypothetical protein